jgi:hypothetical protein
VSERRSYRWVSRADSGIASIAPKPGISRATPSPPAPTPTWSATQGRRAANEPMTTPCTANNVEVAMRARRRVKGARVSSTGTL